MLSRHRVLSVVMLASFAALAGCGGSETSAPVEELDTGTTDDTGSTTETGDDTGTTDDTGAADDTGTADDTGSTTDTGTATETGDDTAPPADTGMAGDSAGDTTTPADTAGDTAVPTDTGSDTGTVADTAAAPTCGGTTLSTTAGGMAYPDRVVRQGFGNLYIAVTGTNLAGVTAVSLGTIACTISTKTATTIAAVCAIPHGAVVGPRDLTLTSPDGVGTCAATVTIDRITSNASTGNDTTGRGTTTSPYRSMRQALTVADSGDTVFLAAGVYGAASGDTWTTTGGTDPFLATASLKAGVTVLGDPGGGTQLSGADNRIPFRLPTGNTTLTDLTLVGFRFGVGIDNGTVTMTNVVIRNSIREAVFATSNAANVVMSTAMAGSGATPSRCLLESNYIGIHARNGAKATLTNCDVTKSVAGGAQLEGTGAPTLTTTSTRFLDNGTAAGTGFATWGKVGILAEDASVLTMTGGEVTRSFDYGIIGTNSPTITLNGTNITQNGLAIGGTSTANSGLSVQNTGATTPGVLKASALTVSGNAFFGVGISGNWNVELTGVSITANGNSGLSFGSSGTLAAKGVSVTNNNTSAANANNAQISITDGANASTKIEFLADGTTQSAVSRSAASNTVPLVRDGRGFVVAGMGTIIQFGNGTLFQGATMPAATHTAPATAGPATPFNVSNAGMTSLVFRLVGGNRRVQVL